MQTTLAAEDFEPFFTEVHGHAPFSWQSELLRSVSAARAWPDLLDVPTGGGKTALLDVALFALALDAAAPVEQRWAPRRIAMVVDRRIVVDQTARRAERIAHALVEPTGEVVRAVADALRGLSVSGLPARSATLRGGLVRDVAWAGWPDVPLLLSSTVDQVGSRLLFRGYGVSSGMRPVHAGLLGNDTLILLDEVHLSQPFAETLRQIRNRYRDVTDAPFPNRWGVVELSATPGSSARRSIVVDPAAAPRRPSDELLAQRFSAAKPTRLRTVPGKRGVDTRVALAAAAVDEVRAVLDRSAHVRRLGVVVNRVATAHAIARQLEELFPAEAMDEHRTRVEVLTGRMRPLDRDLRVADVNNRLAAGTPRDPVVGRMVLVATQCIEAGADLDLDGLITECASLDALRQRFGRVDRLGELTRGGSSAVGVILGTSEDLAPGADDPVYGSALSATWAWLAAKDQVDFGVQALGPPSGGDLLPLLAPRDRAPLLRPGDLDRWVQTAPLPSPDPDPALWLHGLGAAPPEVTLVWRADLTEELLRADPNMTSVVAALPPTNSEAVAVPVTAVRRWLVDRTLSPIADIDGVAASEDSDARTCSPFLVWMGDQSRVGARPSDVRPGDVVAVPAAYGGYSRGGWDPMSAEPVTDVAHEAHVRDHGTVTLRLRAHLWPEAPNPPGPDAGDSAGDASIDTAVAEWLDAVPDRELSPVMAGVVDWLRGRDGRGRRRYVARAPFDGADWLVLVGRQPLPSAMRVAGASETVDSEPDTSSFTSAEVSLDEHLTGVGALAGQLARTVGLPEAIARDLELAGRLHDLGKADDRFQLMLRRGDKIAATMSDHPLAKSALAADDRVGRRRAAQLSGYPRGMRHEMLSVAMVQDVAELRARALDWDLVLHLVASHHGHARPFAPAVLDPSPRLAVHAVDETPVSADSDHGLAALDSGVAQRFWTAVRRYGWFRLAWMEAILRLADHRCSEREQQRQREEGP